MQNLALAESNTITVAEIAEQLGISLQAVRKKIQKRGIQPVTSVSYGGRPMLIYSISILDEFNVPARRSLAGFSQLSLVGGKDMGIMDSSLALRVTDQGEKIVKRRARNGSAGKPRGITIEMERALVAEVKKRFLDNGRSNAAYGITYEVAQENWELIQSHLDAGAEIEKFVEYLYKKRIMRKDKYFTGYFHKEKWNIEWRKLHKVNETNAKGPTKRYDFPALFKSAGEAGPGFGAGALWVIDGTQLDIWVRSTETGKPVLKNFLCIMDALTGMPLWLEKMDAGETINVAVKALYNCARIHGLPKLGIVLDNGRAFVSNEVQQFISNWYTAEELREIAESKLRRALFEGQKAPATYPLAKIPRFAAKARLERTFDELNKFGALHYPKSYQGSTDKRRLSHEKGSTPTTALKEAADETEVWQKFLAWIYQQYVHTQRPASQGVAKAMGAKEATIAEAWKFFGGAFGEKANQLPPRADKKELPSSARAWASLAAIPLKDHSRVKLKGYYASITRDKINYNYVIEEIPISLQEEKVLIAQDLENPRKAYFFKEYDPKCYSDLTPREGDIYYVGEAYDTWRRDINDPSVNEVIKNARRNAITPVPAPEIERTIKLNPKKEIFVACEAKTEDRGASPAPRALREKNQEEEQIDDAALDALVENIINTNY